MSGKTDVNLTDKHTVNDERLEFTITPENHIDVEVIITSSNDELIANCDKNELAIKLFKKSHLQWIDGVWKRSITLFSGSYVDRAAELASILLKYGFTIVCYDKDVLKKAQAGNYEEECRFWVRTYKNSDSLFITLYSKNDVLYNAARKITSSVWDKDKNAIKISLLHFKEVLEFANKNNLKITEKAMTLINEHINSIDDFKPVPINTDM